MPEVASLTALIGADTTGFSAALAAAEGSLRRFAGNVEAQAGKASAAFAANINKIGAAGESLKNLGGNLTLGLTAPLVLFGGAALKAAGDFESGFNRVQAATQASGAQLEELRQKALGISLDPKLKFSATEAASALENLAKNGLTTAQILGGAADASVNLATATGGQLATSADIATDVMNNFNLTAQQLAASVDNITGTTIASKLDIDNYRQALGQAGGVAGQLGVKFSDFNAALAVTSSGFSSGSDAGTSFKTFLQRLVPQSKEAAAAMKQLGLNFFNAQGQLKPLREIAGELQRAFKGLSDEQRNQLGTQIFGADSIRTALLLAKDGAEGFDKMAASIGKVNAAAQGEILSKGFTGALQAAKSALEGFQIALGESGLLDLGTGFLKSGASFLSGLAQLDPAILRTGTALAAAAAAIGPLLGGIGALGVAIPALATGFATIGAAVGLAAGPLALLVVGVGAAAVAIITNWDSIVSYFSGPEGQIFRDVADSAKEAFAELAPALEFALEALKTQFKTNLGILLAIGKGVFSGLGETAKAGFDLITDTFQTFRALFTGDFTAFAEGIRRVWADGFLLMTGAVRGFATSASRTLADLADKAGQADLAARLRQTADATEQLSDKLRGVTSGGNTGISPYFAGLNANIAGFTALVPPAAAAAGTLGAAADKAAAGVAALSEAQQKALASFRQALRDNDNLSRALGQDEGLRVVGNDYDYVSGRAKALESGITSLIRAGFGPQSAVVQNAVSELQRLKNAYDDLSRIELRSSNIETGFKVPPLNTSAYDFSVAVFEGTALRVADTIANLELPPLPPLPAFDSTALSASVEGLNNIVIDIGAIIESGLSTIIADSAAAFGELLAANASAGDVLAGVFKTVLLGMAEFGQQLGAMLIAQGTAVLFAKSIGANPVGAIAAGAALIAISSAAGALLRKGPNLTGGGGGGGATTAGSANTVRPNANARPEPIRIDLNLQPVEIRQKGPDLAGVLALDKYRRRRAG